MLRVPAPTQLITNTGYWVWCAWPLSQETQLNMYSITTLAKFNTNHSMCWSILRSYRNVSGLLEHRAVTHYSKWNILIKRNCWSILSSYRNVLGLLEHRVRSFSFPGSTPVYGVFFFQEERVQIITHVHPRKKKTSHTGVDPGKLNERTHRAVTHYSKRNILI